MRRPHIDPSIIRNSLRPVATYKDGYAQHCSEYEPVGMDGRNDWFRWSCRDCDQPYISMRAEKSMKYYRCTECNALHFVYKGFFGLPDGNRGEKTVPLRPSEVDGVLARCKLDYAPDGTGVGQPEWYYGNPEYLKEKMERDNYVTVECMEEIV